MNNSTPNEIPKNNSNTNNDINNTQNTTNNLKPNTNNIEKNNLSQNTEQKPRKNSSLMTIIFLLIIAGFCFYTYYTYNLHQQEIETLKESCSPVSTSGETKKLDLDATIVKDLYAKVKTNIREDLANMELNAEMKLYLAARQIPASKIYSSNCNYFNNAKMSLYTCKESADFTPQAFKEEELALEYKKLFGENSEFNHNDIQLGMTCLGGYQYIAERGEYVSGNCTQISTTVYRANKELINATSTESTIILYENVKYYGTEGKELPEKLISGTYKYTFKLDSNYNYVYLSKELEK